MTTVRAHIVLIALIIGLSGLTYMRNAIWADEEALWESALAESPEKIRPMYHAGIAASDPDDSGKAFAYLRQVKEKNSAFFKFYLFRSIEKLREAGRYNEALDEYQLLLQRAPNEPNILNRIGNIYFLKGMLAEAEHAYREAIRFRPGFSEAHCNLGQVYQEMGLFGKAAHEYRTAIALSPSDPTPHAELARHFAERGLIDEALGEVRKALALDPDHASAKQYLDQIMKHAPASKN